MDDDARLLERARALDEAALAAIFDAHYNAIYRYIYLHIGHTETAEDLSAQVFRRLLEKLREGAGPDRYLKAWLFRVASNLIVDETRRAQHRHHLPLDEDLSADGATPEDTAQQALLLAQLRAALDTLTPPQRSAIILRYLMDMPNEEIAEIMGMTIGAVKAQQHRGLAALRARMSEEDSREQST
ncbi:MAG: sigma-70 family RNA polymerase sigma factor [Anaerolineae bacterium]